MYKSQEMPDLWRFLARFLPSDNQMTIILDSNHLYIKFNFMYYYSDCKI